MFPKSHIILGFIFSLILLLLFPLISWTGFLIIFASSVLIDVDHYLFYVFIKKNWSLKNAYNWFSIRAKRFEFLPKPERKKKAKSCPCIFHGIEAIIILILLSFYHKFFLYILIGFVFHEILDLIKILNDRYDLNHIGSQTYNIITFVKNK